MEQQEGEEEEEAAADIGMSKSSAFGSFTSWYSLSPSLCISKFYRYMRMFVRVI